MSGSRSGRRGRVKKKTKFNLFNLNYWRFTTKAVPTLSASFFAGVMRILTRPRWVAFWRASSDSPPVRKAMDDDDGAARPAFDPMQTRRSLDRAMAQSRAMNFHDSSQPRKAFSRNRKSRRGCDGNRSAQARGY